MLFITLQPTDRVGQKNDRQELQTHVNNGGLEVVESTDIFKCQYLFQVLTRLKFDDN